MGNTEKANLSIDPNFSKFCHKQLAFGKLNQNSGAIEITLTELSKYHQWRWNLYPLATYSKHLMMPKYFTDNKQNLVGCRTQNDHSSLQNSITVGYQPFIYTLQNEIMSRKFHNNVFTQKQLWKMLKYFMQGFSNWLQAYPDLPIGQIAPNNIIFDSKGHLKLVHIFSFPPYELVNIKGVTFRYNQINPMNSLMKKGPRIEPKHLFESYKKQIISCLLCAGFMEIEYVNGFDTYMIEKCEDISAELKEIIFMVLKAQNKQQFNSIISQVNKRPKFL